MKKYVIAKKIIEEGMVIYAIKRDEGYVPISVLDEKKFIEIYHSKKNWHIVEEHEWKN